MVKLENGLKPSALLRLYVSYLRHAIQIAVVAVAHPTMGCTHFKEKNMAILSACWFISGIIALFAFSERKKSFIGGLLKELFEAKKAEDILIALLGIIIIVPSVIAVGPITLIRFWVDFD